MIAAALELVRIRCRLDAEQAMSYLANYATMCGLTVEAAARQLLSSTRTAAAPIRSAELSQIIPGPTGQLTSRRHERWRTAPSDPREHLQPYSGLVLGASFDKGVTLAAVLLASKHSTVGCPFYAA